MTFSLQGFKAYPIRTDGATRQHAVQVALLKIVSANTDVALDIASDTSGSLGTFWTAATGDSTYGQLATDALGVVQTIQNIAAQLIEVSVPASYTKVVSSPTGAEYTVGVTNNLPTITYVSGSAPTTQIVRLEWVLQDTKDALVADYGAAF